ncbi:hypothetical protein HD554DRAFT_1478275 [Boletus coccyginus]|nr:hypothetical protein HD554DRAFT_1478275 [Boletus coccyginus]
MKPMMTWQRRSKSTLCILLIIPRSAAVSGTAASKNAAAVPPPVLRRSGHPRLARTAGHRSDGHQHTTPTWSDTPSFPRKHARYVSGRCATSRVYSLVGQRHVVCLSWYIAHLNSIQILVLSILTWDGRMLGDIDYTPRPGPAHYPAEFGKVAVRSTLIGQCCPFFSLMSTQWFDWEWSFSVACYGPKFGLHRRFTPMQPLGSRAKQLQRIHVPLTYLLGEPSRYPAYFVMCVATLAMAHGYVMKGALMPVRGHSHCHHT